MVLTAIKRLGPEMLNFYEEKNFYYFPIIIKNEDLKDHLDHLGICNW